MEQWSLSHYVKPVLYAPILVKNAQGMIEIGENYPELEITSGEPDKLLGLLKSLSEGCPNSWETMRHVLEDSDEQQVLDVLHEYGFIRETSPEHTLAKKQVLIEKVLDEALDTLSPWEIALCIPATELLTFSNSLKNADITDILAHENNAFLLYGKVALLSWEQLCPPAVNVTHQLLSRLTGSDNIEPNIDLTAFWAGEVRKCLSVITWSLVRSLDGDSTRKEFPKLLIEAPDSGTNLALRLERWAKDSLESFGPAKFAPALRTNEHGAQQTLIQAVYAQEYYITERFIDLVSNAMALRLPRPLKRLLRRYYSEEMGHESYELRTCLALGLDEDEIHSAIPTPCAQLLCDTYTWLAGNHVIAYAAAATITEGLPGQPNIINEAVANSGVFAEEVNENSRKHEALNEKLFHPYISRLLLAECGEQSVKTQQIARDCYGLLLEMTWRTWEELEKLHVTMNRPALNFAMKDFLHS
ncbi:iron-containing redox enzyme family protein [Photorhabdus tasmaniensis]|uniref:iron-containing redox enzyme family protein n=1 Tax=Photorhabdus tasmaniensis TaxID=1004159 RepID=UPI00105D32D0|nr:iron-containing redox enzyme family protein [Photorhabdus tasmaniensis]